MVTRAGADRWWDRCQLRQRRDLRSRLPDRTLALLTPGPQAVSPRQNTGPTDHGTPGWVSQTEHWPCLPQDPRLGRRSCVSRAALRWVVTLEGLAPSASSFSRKMLPIQHGVDGLLGGRRPGWGSAAKAQSPRESQHRAWENSGRIHGVLAPLCH